MKRKTPYWWKAIEDAKKRGHFTGAQIAMSADWQTCACGKQDKRIPRGGNHWNESAPDDDALAQLGLDFCNAIESGEPFLASDILSKIETRAAQILARVAR